MAASFRIHGFMKAIRRKGNTITHSNNLNLNRFIVPRRCSLSSCFISNYRSKSFYSSSCEHPINDVIKEFDDMIQKRPLPPVQEFNLLLHNLATQKTSYDSCTLVLEGFKRMSAVGIPINTSIADSLIKCYCHLHQTKLSFTVLGCCLKQGIECNNVSMYNTILDGFIGEDKTHEAEKLFKKMFIFNNNNDDDDESADQLLLSEPDIVTYNTMLEGLCKVGDNFTAIGLLRLMDGRGCKPNLVSYNTIIDGLCCDSGVVNTTDDAFKLFEEMVFVKGIHPDANTYDLLIHAFSKLGRWDDLCKMLKRLEEDESIFLDMKMMNIIVDALCKQDKLVEVFPVYILMKKNGYHPDIVTYNSIIHMFCSQGLMSRARNMFGQLGSDGVESADTFTYNTLIDGYIKNMKVDEATEMFRLMPKQHVDQVTQFLSAVLYLGINHHHYKYEFEYQDVKRLYLSLLYIQNAEDDSYEKALKLFDFMDGHELNSDIEVYNILIFGANKCGKFDIARNLFHELTAKGLKPDSVTYTLIIHGFCKQGLVKNAKRMFVKMKRTGFVSNRFVHDIDQLPLCYLEENSDFYGLACEMYDVFRDIDRSFHHPLIATLSSDVNVKSNRTVSMYY